MRSSFLRLLGLVVLLLTRTPTLSAQLTAADSTQLVAITRRLLDAITPGDTVPWASVLAPDWFQTDEEGRHVTRADFLAGMAPLPAGQSGTLTLGRYHLVGNRQMAVVSYDIEEEHHYYDQLLRTRFHTTESYARNRHGWQQVASQVTALPTPVVGLPLADARKAAYTGAYRLTPEIALEIIADDSGLVLQRPGRPGARLRALDDRLFVRNGVRGFWVFEHDTAGHITTLVNWRDNNPVTWVRQR